MQSLSQDPVKNVCSKTELGVDRVLSTTGLDHPITHSGSIASQYHEDPTSSRVILFSMLQCFNASIDPMLFIEPCFFDLISFHLFGTLFFFCNGFPGRRAGPRGCNTPECILLCIFLGQSLEWS